MSFRERMKISPSKGDMQLRSVLKFMIAMLPAKKELYVDFLPQGRIIVFDNKHGYGISDRIYEAKEKTQFTVPDALLLLSKQLPCKVLVSWTIAVYLDGPVHKRKGVQKRDERINQLLKREGIVCMRFDYHPPLSNKRLKEIVETIKGELTA